MALLASMSGDIARAVSAPARLPTPGAEEAAAIESLPLLRTSSITRQLSSRDKAGGNADGFGASSELYRSERGEYVVFDDYGPGCIYRSWFTGYWNWLARVRIYVDDMDDPVVDSRLATLFSSGDGPLSGPLTLGFLDCSGAWVSYVPICYGERARITLDMPPEFFNFTYRRYAADQVLESFTGAEDHGRLERQWEEPTRDPKPRARTRTVDRALRLGPGEVATLLDEPGAGAIWNLHATLDPLREDVASSIWIRATWDDRPEADLAAPLGELFGARDPDRAPASLLVGRNADTLYSRFPMPFWSRARFEVENRGEVAATMSWRFEIRDDPYPADAGYFAAVYRAEAPTRLGRDYELASVEGTGHLVGVTYTMEGPRSLLVPSLGYMEGDERFTTDGSMTPQVQGTGTEDYFNGGWYFVNGEFSAPHFGNTESSIRIGNRRSRTGCYRFHVGDLVPFRSSARMGIEHDKSNGVTDDRHSSVTYLYVRPSSDLARGDTLDLGEAESEAAHAYASEGSAPTGWIEGSFEGDDDDVFHTERGYSVTGWTEFVVRTPPDNDGVLLRRRFDQTRGRQHAGVYVDGAWAGTWYDVFENGVKRLAESEILLPASVTAGKESLRIRIEKRGETPWSELRYVTHPIRRGSP